MSNLTEKEREIIAKGVVTTKQVAKPSKQKNPEFRTDGVRWKKVTWSHHANARCPFCTEVNEGRHQKCVSCKAYNYHYGDVHVYYKTETGGKAGTATLQKIRDDYMDKFGRN